MRSVLALAAVLLAPACCALVDKPVLALRSIAGGIHNKRQVSGIRPFFLADGRLGVVANGALVVEEAPGGKLVTLLESHHELDDPDPSATGALACVSGGAQVTAGGGHNDHVFQVVRIELAGPTLERVTRSRRAEVLPRWTQDGARLVFARRAEYDGWSCDPPWGPASLFIVDADGTDERRLTEPLFHPLLGLALAADDTLAVLAARPAGEAAPSLFAVDLPAGGAPRRLAAGAYLPVVVPGTDELLVARPFPDGHGLARVGLDGTTRWERPLGLGDLVGLARAPDGRIALADFDPRAGQFGTYRLWSLATEAAQLELLARVPYRLERAFKPLDVVKPPGWWFRPEASPGSR